MEEIFTFEDFRARLNHSAEVQAEILEQEQEVQEEKRNKMPKRQQGLQIISISYSTTKSDERYQASNVLSSGAEETWNFEESISIGVEFSVTMGASFFDIFTAEASISTSIEHTESVSNGMRFTVGNCPYEAVVFWLPLYDHYWVQYDDGQFNDIWVPVGLNGAAAGRWHTECMGGP